VGHEAVRPSVPRNAVIAFAMVSPVESFPLSIHRESLAGLLAETIKRLYNNNRSHGYSTAADWPGLVAEAAISRCNFFQK
jgi:hypothetical protein